jgi:glycosyltransferase involved in cell wall biosynthesis
LSLCVLSVAYPFARVSADPVGGAEQVLSALDRALVAQGARSVVLACEGSTPAGELAAVPAPRGEVDEAQRARIHGFVRRALGEAVERLRPDVVHLHGVDFDCYLPAPGPASLVTLHLPLAWYPDAALAPARPATWLVPVSADQARRAPPGARLEPPIENGVDVAAFRAARKRGFAVALGRICPEKGYHLALDAARAADLPLLLAGSVFPYAEHRRYFEHEIRPRLDASRRWIGPVAGRAKRRLLAAARCLVAPSLAPETSSLAAREALAAGTPVVALRRGALAEVVDEGRTGFLVDAPEALPQAMREAGRLGAEDCRRAAQARFSLSAMTDAYLRVYRRLASSGTWAPPDAGWAR